MDKIKCYNVPVKTCCRQIIFSVNDDNILTSCKFVNGCSGNLQAISKLVVGKPIDYIIETLKGIPCQITSKGPISCPDQLAKALSDYKAEKLNAEKIEAEKNKINT